MKTMQEMKKVIIVNGKAIFDIDTLFARLLVVGQQRGVEVTDIFQYELSRVPPSLIDEFGCLRKGDKTVLVKCLGVPANSAPAPDVVLVDASQLLNHVVWPVAETACRRSCPELRCQIEQLSARSQNNWCCLTAITRINQLRRSTGGLGEPERDRRTSI